MTSKHVLTLIEALPLAEYTRQELAVAEPPAQDCIECRQALADATWLDSELGRQPEPVPPAGLAAAIVARTARLDEEAPPASGDQLRVPVAEAERSTLVGGHACGPRARPRGSGVRVALWRLDPRFDFVADRRGNERPHRNAGSRHFRHRSRGRSASLPRGLLRTRRRHRYLRLPPALWTPFVRSAGVKHLTQKVEREK